MLSQVLVLCLYAYYAACNSTLEYKTISIDSKELSKILTKVGIEYTPDPSTFDSIQASKCFGKNYDSDKHARFKGGVDPADDSLVFLLPKSKTIDDFVQFSLGNLNNVSNALDLGNTSVQIGELMESTVRFINEGIPAPVNKTFSMSADKLKDVFYNTFKIENDVLILGKHESGDEKAFLTAMMTSFLDDVDAYHLYVFLPHDETVEMFMSSSFSSLPHDGILHYNDSTAYENLHKAHYKKIIEGFFDKFLGKDDPNARIVPFKHILTAVEKTIEYIPQFIAFKKALVEYEFSNEGSKLFLIFENMAAESDDSFETIVKDAVPLLSEGESIPADYYDKALMEIISLLQNEVNQCNRVLKMGADQLQIVSVKKDEFDEKVKNVLRLSKLTLQFDAYQTLGTYANEAFNTEVDNDKKDNVYRMLKAPYLKFDSSNDQEQWKNYAYFVKSKTDSSLTKDEAEKQFKTLFFDDKTRDEYVEKMEEIEQEQSNSQSKWVPQNEFVSKMLATGKAKKIDAEESTESNTLAIVVLCIVTGLSSAAMMVYIIVKWRRRKAKEAIKEDI